MKKLLALAALAATAPLFAAVESPNIVGYQNKEVRKLLSQQIVTFDKIGVDGIDIQGLLPVDGDGAYVGGGEVTVQFINDRGKVTGSYSYYGKDEYDDGFAAGWYDEGTDELADYTFENGEAFMVLAGEACNFTYNGEVNMLATYIPCRKLLSVQGNIRPAAVNIQTLVPYDSTDEADQAYVGGGEVTVQFTNDRGKVIGSYSYYGKDEYDDGFAAGWYDEGTDELAVYSFGAGEGFLMLTGQACYLKFPAL